jgi:hypothetical protein
MLSRKLRGSSANQILRCKRRTCCPASSHGLACALGQLHWLLRALPGSCMPLGATTGCPAALPTSPQCQLCRCAALLRRTAYRRTMIEFATMQTLTSTPQRLVPITPAAAAQAGREGHEDGGTHRSIRPMKKGGQAGTGGLAQAGVGAAWDDRFTTPRCHWAEACADISGMLVLVMGR